MEAAPKATRTAQTMSSYDVPTDSDFLPEGEVSFQEASPSTRWEVSGRVRGAFPENASVRAVVTTLRDRTLDEQVVGEAPIDESGSYWLAFDQPSRPEEASDATLGVRLYAPSGELIGESAPGAVAGCADADRRATVPCQPGPSEYALFERHVAEGLEAGVAGLDGADESVIEEVSEWLDVDAERLTLFQQARALEGRDRASRRRCSTRSGAAAWAGRSRICIDVPIHELRTTIEEAVADGIVDAARCSATSSALVERLADARSSSTRVDPAGSRGRDSGEVLAAADLPPRRSQQVLRRYQARTVSASEFWESFTAVGETAEGRGRRDGPRRRGRGSAGRGAGARSGAAAADARASPRGTLAARPKDLPRFSFDDWCELLEEAGVAATLEDVDAEDAEAEEEAQERIEARAEAILDTLEEAFPSAFIRRRLARRPRT